VAVEGGAFLVPDRLAGVSQIVRVPNGDCANAVGAAIAQISGETDQVYRDLGRNEAIAAAEAQARERRLPPVPIARACRSSMSRICRWRICRATPSGFGVRGAGKMATPANQNGSSSVSQ